MTTSQEAKQKEFVDSWMDQIKLGLKYKEKFSDCKMWDTYRNWYRGDFGDEAKNQTIVNRIYSVIKSMVPRIYFRTPSISITARTPEKVAHAHVVEPVDNWLVQEMKLKKQIKKSVLDACICGTGVLKLGYDSEYGYTPEQGVAENGETATQVSVKSGEKLEYNTGIQPGMPWVQRIRPDEIITPYGFSDPDDLPWVGHMFIRPLQDCKEDQKYDSKARKELKGGFTALENDRPYKFMQDNSKCDYCLVYEIRDYRSGRMYVFSENRLLMDVEDTLQIDGLPYEFIIFNEDPEHFWGISDVRMLAPQQTEINEIRTQASRMRRLNLLKFAYTRGAVDPENLEKLLSSSIDDVGAGIEVKADSIAASIQFLQPHNLTTELIREQQQTESDLRDTVGYSSNQMGEYVPFHNKTAAEAKIVDQASSIRSDERRDAVADVLQSVMRKVNQIIFKFWTSSRVVAITGPIGEQAWIEYTGEQLRGEYNLIVNPETGQPVSRATRQQTAIELFTMLNNDPLIDQVGLRRIALKETDNIDPGYQTLVRNPQMEQPQAEGEMPGMPGIPAAGQPTGGPAQPQANPQLQQIQQMMQQSGQANQQAQMAQAKHNQQMNQSAQKHQMQMNQMAMRNAQGGQ